ncbi:MAG: response regulator transcription factor [Alphaproteobacteria bacterium]|nr:response regulator transcription factor [Alphaproteobacteria bacterium]
MKIAALDLGASDYIVKPFDVTEVLARVRAALRHRHAETSKDTTIKVGDVDIDLARRHVRRHGRLISLTRKEFEILSLLASARGRVVTHYTIMGRVWPLQNKPNVRYLHTSVHHLRLKLERRPKAPGLVMNKLGVGYWLNFKL